MISASVNVVGTWGAEYARRINAQVAAAMTEASERGAQAASRASASRRRTGKMARITAVPTVGTPTGWQGGFGSEAFYAHMQSGGTSRGVTPLRFLEAGRTEGRKYLKERLSRL